MADATAASANPAQKKKLPFKPTALRKASLPKPSSSPDNAPRAGGSGCAADDDDDGLQLFRRSAEMAPIVAADRERRIRRKQQRQRDKEEARRRSSGEKRPLDDDEDLYDDDREDARRKAGPRKDSAGEQPPTDESLTLRMYTSRDLFTPPPSKRSRLGTSSSSNKPTASIEDDHPFDESPSIRRTRSQSKNSTPRNRTQRGEEDATRPEANSTSLDSDSDSDVQIVDQPSKRRASVEVMDRAASAELSPPPEDDPFAEYVQRAVEERARYSARDPAARDKTEIIVTSTVPDAKPCCVKFTFDKPLRLVRDSWVALQDRHRIALDGAASPDDVVLTWRRKKVYNVSTLLSLGIRPRPDGRLAASSPAYGAAARHPSISRATRGGLSDNATRVHMEAWTPPLFHAMEREEEARRRRDAGEGLSDDEDDDVAAAAKAPPAEPEVKIRVVLRARDLPDVRLTARPETTAETLATGFRTARGLGAGRVLVLRFDGEALEEHRTIEDAEIGDMDTIEVYIK